MATQTYPGINRPRTCLQTHTFQLCTYINLVLTKAFRVDYKASCLKWNRGWTVQTKFFFPLSHPTVTCCKPINLAGDRCLSLRVRGQTISSLPPAGSWSTTTMCDSVCLLASPDRSPASNQISFLCKTRGNILYWMWAKSGLTSFVDWSVR